MSERVNRKLMTFVVEQSLATLFGRVVACDKCGHMILVEATEADPRSGPTLSAACLACVVVSDKFRAVAPDASAAVERWKSELQPGGQP